MAKEKVKKIWELLSKVSYELDQIKRGCVDIETLKEWVKNKNVYITFNYECWRCGEFWPNLLTSDFIYISKLAIAVIYKRLEQRNDEALEYIKEIKEMLTEVEEEANE